MQKLNSIADLKAAVQEYKHILPKVDIENAMKPIPSTNDKEDENEIDKDKNMIKSNEDFVN